MTTKSTAAAPSTDTSSLQRALDGLRAGLQVIGFDWRYLYLNHAAAAHGRRRPEDLIGHTMMEMYPGIEDTPVFEMLHRCMSDRQAAVAESLFTFPDGQARWLEVRVEQSSEGICVYSFDIHERKVRQLALEARQAELNAMPVAPAVVGRSRDAPTPPRRDRWRGAPRMTTWDERMGPRASAGPTPELIEMCWRMESLQKTTRVLGCGIYRGRVGLEVRVGYGPKDLLYSRLTPDLEYGRSTAEELAKIVRTNGGFKELA